ncbi:MAG: DinB family protein [Caldilineaceae bacterium]|nr:DinB family protein [Caldilineaceae bacterium]
MRNEQYLLLFDHHYWAMNHLTEVMSRLPESQLTTQSVHFYHVTANQTLLHILDVDWSWIQWCMGLPAKSYLWEVQALPDIEAMRLFLKEEGQRVKGYVSGLTEQELDTEIDFGSESGSTPRRTKRWKVLLHIITHAVEHKTELGHFLTECGHSPGELNFIHYLANVRHPDTESV